MTTALYRSVWTSILVAAAVCGLQAQDRTETVQSEIRQLFDIYFEYFGHGRAKEISESVYRAPVWIGATSPRSLATSADVEAFFGRMIGAIKDAGYSHSEIIDLAIRQLNPSAALAELTYRRYLKDGSVMGAPVRRGTYIVFLTEDGWRITALIGHQD